MSGTSASEDVGSDLIDAYLIAVENALVSAGAPRADRMQVLQNLETQIAEMLAPLPLPFSEETVRSVIAKLEPPSHFGTTYDNGTTTESPSPKRFSRMPNIRWPFIAALSCGMLPLAFVLTLLVAAMRVSGPVVGVILLVLFAGFVLTPFALWRAFRQLRTQPGQLPGRDLVLNSTVVYGTIAPVLLMGVFAIATQGYALIPFGIAAFVYLQYVLIRRLWCRMSDALPPQSASASKGEPNGHGARSPISSATPMPAM